MQRMPSIWSEVDKVPDGNGLPSMTKLSRLCLLTLGMVLWGLSMPAQPQAPSATPGSPQPCQPSVLSRLRHHKIAPGETLASIAQQYQLLPATLLGMNPKLRQGKTPVGINIIIPPFNGMFVAVPPDKTLREVAKAYQVRVEGLYTQNGCTFTPKIVFVLGAVWSPLIHTQPTAIAPFQATPRRQVPRLSAQIRGDRYPLPQVAAIIVPFGWRVNPQTQQRQFYSGVDLAAAPGTSVFAVASGIVAFAGAHRTLGQQIVINHAQGRQTRYARLATLQVATGQRVQRGQLIAMVGGWQRRRSHLRFEVRYRSAAGWVAQDPQPYLAAIAKP